jgi:septal ring-binding cell division protein DamX
VTKTEKERVKPKTEPSRSVKEPSKAADKSSQADSSAWVEGLDPNVWVMQHGAFESLAEARNFQATSLGYQSGQVLFTQRKGSKPYYILITGPYTDREQAQALMKQNPPLAKAWVRSAKSIKAQFQD